MAIIRNQYFLRTGQVLLFILRRERLRIVLWTAAVALCIAALVATFPRLYPDDTQRQTIAATMHNPAVVAMIGPVYGSDDYHVGAMTSHQMLLFSVMTVGLFSILFTNRLTRSEEDKGLTEIVHNAPVGRFAPLAASLLSISFTHVSIGVSTTLALASLRIPSVTVSGSLLFGAAFIAIGLFFMGFTATMAQLTNSARTTLTVSIGFFLILYIMRAIGDLQAETLSLLSPLGFILRAKIYVENNAFPIVLTASFGTALSVLALLLYSVRDIGTSFIRWPAKWKRSTNRLAPRTIFSFIWHDQKTTIIAWAVGMMVLGASYGAVFHDIDAFITGGDLIQNLFVFDHTASYAEQFFATVSVVLTMLATIPTLIIVMNIIRHEQRSRLSLLLVQGVSRRSVLLTAVTWSIIVAIIMLTASMFGVWFAMVQSGVILFPLTTALQGIFIYSPAILFMVGVAIVAIGIVPQRASLIWLYLALSFFVMYFGPLFNTPRWLHSIIPFEFIPKYPVESWNGTSSILLIFSATILFAIGVRCYEQRDILK